MQPSPAVRHALCRARLTPQRTGKRQRSPSPERPGKRRSGSARTPSEQDPVVLEALQQVLDEKRLLEELIAAHKEEMARTALVEEKSRKVMHALKVALEFEAAGPARKRRREDGGESSRKRRRSSDAGATEEADADDGTDGNEDGDEVGGGEASEDTRRWTDDDWIARRNPKEQTRLFLKKLHPEITEEKLREAFRKCGTIERVFFVKDKDTQKFYGTAFVEMADAVGAAKALGLKGVKVMGKPLTVRLAKDEVKLGRGAQAAPEDLESQRPHTVFVGNLPDDCDRVMFKRDFKLFGDIVSLRFVQDKITGEFKRCAFVGYRTAEGAEKALERHGAVWMGKALNIELAKR